MTYLRCVVWRRVFQEVAVKLLAGAAVIERLGWGRGICFKVAPSPGCWQEESVLQHIHLPLHSTAECPQSMAAHFPKKGWPEEESKQEATVLFLDIF